MKLYLVDDYADLVIVWQIAFSEFPEEEIKILSEKIDSKMKLT